MPFTWSDMEFLEGAAGYFMLVNLASLLLFISKLGLSFFFFFFGVYFLFGFGIRITPAS